MRIQIRDFTINRSTLPYKYVMKMVVRMSTIVSLSAKLQHMGGNVSDILRAKHQLAGGGGGGAEVILTQKNYRGVQFQNGETHPPINFVGPTNF